MTRRRTEVTASPSTCTWCSRGWCCRSSRRSRSCSSNATAAAGTRCGSFVAIGSLAGLYLLGAVLSNDITADIAEHTIQYGGAGRYADIATGLYVIATCGAPLVSSYRQIRWFGVANVLAVTVIAAIQAEGLTSVWCAWAAVVSVLIYLQFASWRRADREPHAMAVA